VIKTFSSRAGRLSSTNKNYLSLQSASLISPEVKPKTNYPIVIDIGFGDAQSFTQDVLANKKFCFIGIEPYKKGFARAVEFYEIEKPENLFLYNGDAREFLEAIDYEVPFFRIHFPDPWPKKKHIKRRLISQKFLHLLDQKICKTGKIEIITDSKIYQDHIEEVLNKQRIFEQIETFEISYEVSTFHNKGLKKGHEIKRYVLTKA
jgi:tRNA (guanine-N7-)-methyltransferase